MLRIRPLFFLIAAASLLAAAGCDDCGSVSRFTDANGLTVLVICGEIVVPTPTPTPSS